MLLRLERSTPEDVSDIHNHKNKNVKVTAWTLKVKGENGGLLHREFGPAIESDDGHIKEWYRYGERHREDGPAVIVRSRQEYWIRGTQLSERDFLNYKKYGY